MGAPEAEVQVGRRRSRARAGVVGPTHPDRARLWALVNGMNGGRYAVYQRRTERPIDLLRLTPTD